MTIKKSMVAGAIATTLLAGCGSTNILLTPEENIDSVALKVSPLTDTQLKHWSHDDLPADTIPGMSVDKAYTDIFNAIKELRPTPVIVGVLDSGIDIEHEDLKNVIWTNEDEIAGNGIDDDKNGFVDDVHGWNFLGKANNEQLELVRIINKGDDGSADYQRAKAEYDEKYNEALQNKTRYEQILQSVTQADELLQKELGKEDYTLEDLKAYKPSTPEAQAATGAMTQMFAYEDSVADLKKELKEGIEYFTDQLNYNLNKDFDGRSIVGDDPDDITDTDYGDNNVIGDREHAKHGTHVAGIIAAQRNNGIGMNGVADHVKIMPVRTVPNGDEYDKDVALAIRYAVDNGAKVINGSFGKYYSPHKQWVWDAIKYAASKDVLIVKAAGNESLDLDENNVYPNDNENNTAEIADNFLTVGALNYEYGPEMVATFSNYGKDNVDVFAPGTKIWSTTPNNGYEFLQGTSMAAPAVAGVAALIRAYFPKLKAGEVKKIIMQSGLTSTANVILGGNPNYKKPFAEASKSGKMVNLYNAMILADKVNAGKVKL
ncbi:S8 family peptidase [Galbibacter pacificus]|uniref:S8 family peptidase n=1 Tax=Galbibacter pacificus TaxID=2996052 RepID=A0ABT6FS81_9FLAO|nr:S8 family peptidase [Galbibacter pacificus]MDG3582972.1 S8 family peptidase [Galbibacter pacificus]MDG3585909.1 S8 family peptidase [Galbibacter pacificus]